MRVLIAGLALVSASALAATVDVCERVNERTSGPEENFRPPLEATVSGADKAVLYSAPFGQCRTQILVPQGASLTVYKLNQDWFEVMYIDREGDDHMGWLQRKHVRVAGPYGGKAR